MVLQNAPLWETGYGGHSTPIGKKIFQMEVFPDVKFQEEFWTKRLKFSQELSDLQQIIRSKPYYPKRAAPSLEVGATPSCVCIKQVGFYGPYTQ